MSAGYSHRPLSAKLGVKPGCRAYFSHCPDGYLAALGDVVATLEISPELAFPLDFIHHFVTEHTALETDFPRLKAALARDGMLWISWPKGQSKAAIATDLDENIVRDVGLRNGLVDVKVCAIDAIWSGLKFVYRRTDRG
jgi:hypothetical protein